MMILHCAVESFNYAVQQADWSAMPTSSNPNINIEYSSTIKEKLTEKRKLCKIWQINRCQFWKTNYIELSKYLKTC